MCTTFTCTSCKLTFYNHCKNVGSDPKAACPENVFTSTPMKCITCETIREVIKKLESLVFRLPFLETSGISGLEELAEWEREDAEKILFKTKGANADGSQWVNKAESREERHKVATKVADMGLGDMEDAREEHQGFGMCLTPEKK